MYLVCNIWLQCDNGRTPDGFRAEHMHILWRPQYCNYSMYKCQQVRSVKCHNREAYAYNNYPSSFVDFVFVTPFVDKHGCEFSIPEHRRIHGDSRGQCEKRLLQGAALHSTAFSTHSCLAVCWTCRARLNRQLDVKQPQNKINSVANQVTWSK